MNNLGDRTMILMRIKLASAAMASAFALTGCTGDGGGSSDSQATAAFGAAWRSLSIAEQQAECIRFAADEDAWMRSFAAGTSNAVPSDNYMRSAMRSNCRRALS